MKRFKWLLAVLVLFAGVIAGCDMPPPSTPVTDETILQGWIDDLGIPTSTDEDLELPTTYEEAVIIWSSGDQSLMTNQGVISRQLFHEGDAEVTLTGNFTYNDVTLIRHFQITIIAYDEETTDAYFLVQDFINDFEFSITETDESLVLPDMYEGEIITWTSNQHEYIEDDGTVHRPLYFDGNKTVTLTAKMELYDFVGETSFQVSVLKLDEETSYGLLALIVEDELDVLFTDTMLSEDLTLPNKVSHANITWSSSNPYAISPKGFVSRPLHGDGTVNVTLTATFDGYVTEVTLDYLFTVTERPEKIVTSSANLPFTNLADEYHPLDGNIDIYYMNDESLPYVEIEAFIAMVKGAIVSDELDFLINGDEFIVQYVVTDEEENPEDPEGDPIITEHTYQLIFNFANNTVTVDPFGFFTAIAEATETDFGQELSVIDSFYIEEPTPVTFNLSFYRIELVRTTEEYLIPFHLANLFLTGQMYDVYYNGEAVYGVDGYQLGWNNPIFDDLTDSALNSGPVPYDMKEMNYHFLTFVFDYFFGLNIATDIDTYYDVFEARRPAMMGDTDSHYKAINDMMVDLDDLHTSYLASGYYHNWQAYQLQWNRMGPRTYDLYNTMFYQLTHCDASSVWVDPTGTYAVIPVHSFTVDSPNDFRADLEYIESLGTVTRVIIDLSCNTGGNVGSLIRKIGYMTDDPIGYHGVSAGDLSTYTSLYDTDNVAFDFEWYILTSPVTYSAANMMTSIAKDMGIATIIGQQSTGGASSIKAIILPTGSTMYISSPRVAANDQHESIEFGIPVHIEIPIGDISSRQAVIDAIIADEAE